MFVSYQTDFVSRVGQFAWVFISVDDLSFLDDVQILIAYDTFMHNWLSSFHNSMCGKQNHIEEGDRVFTCQGFYFIYSYRQSSVSCVLTLLTFNSTCIQIINSYLLFLSILNVLTLSVLPGNPGKAIGIKPVL